MNRRPGYSKEVRERAVRLVLTGEHDHSSRWAAIQSVASFLGLTPIEKRSGKSEYRKTRLSKSGSSHYRQALYFPAMVATRKTPDVQALYERLVVAGKPKMCAPGV